MTTTSGSALSGDLDTALIVKMKGFNILVAGFDSSEEESIRYLLEETSYDYMYFSDIPSAAEEFSANSYECLLLYLNTTSSIESAISSLRAHNAKVPIIILTPSSVPSISPPAVTFIKTPVEKMGLLTLIEENIDKYLHDAPPVDMKRAVDMCGGEESFVVELLSEFMTDVTPRIETLANAIKAHDYHTINEEAHYVKGSAAQLACKPVARSASILEKVGKLELPITEEVQQHLANFQKRMQQLAAFIATL